MIYELMLILSYYFYIHKVYNYEGFIFLLNPYKLIEAIMWSILISFFIPYDEKRPSTILLFILYVFSIIPISLIYSLKDESRVFFYGTVISFLLTIFIVRNTGLIKFNFKISLNWAMSIFFILVTGFVYAGLIISNGFPSLAALNLSKVYAIRGNVRYSFPLLAYLVPWQGLVINPYLIITFVQNKKKLKLMVIFGMQFVLYLLTSQKAYILFPLMLPAIIFIIKKGQFIKLFSLASIGMIFISLGLYLMNSAPMVAVLYLYRTIFLPAQISFQYVEYFSEHGFVLLSHSIFRFLFQEPIYEIHPVKIIGKLYYYNNFPNTGYLADAYMNFGIIGMIAFSGILGLILIIIDSLSNNSSKKNIACSFMLITATYLLNGALLTALLTGGTLLFMVIMLVYDSGKHNNSMNLEKKTVNISWIKNIKKSMIYVRNP